MAAERYDAFVSYGHGDAEWVHTLAGNLERLGAFPGGGGGVDDVLHVADRDVLAGQVPDHRDGEPLTQPDSNSITELPSPRVAGCGSPPPRTRLRAGRRLSARRDGRPYRGPVVGNLWGSWSVQAPRTAWDLPLFLRLCR